MGDDRHGSSAAPARTRARGSAARARPTRSAPGSSPACSLWSPAAVACDGQPSTRPDINAVGLRSVDETPFDASWEREAENWVRWARKPGHDAYWVYSPAFFDEIVRPPGRQTLEVGCGEGRVARDLKPRGHRLMAIDNSPTLVRYAKQADRDGRYELADACRSALRGWQLRPGRRLQLPDGRRRYARRRPGSGAGARSRWPIQHLRHASSQ